MTTKPTSRSCRSASGGRVDAAAMMLYQSSIAPQRLLRAWASCSSLPSNDQARPSRPPAMAEWHAKPEMVNILPNLFVILWTSMMWRLSRLLGRRDFLLIGGKGQSDCAEIDVQATFLEMAQVPKRPALPFRPSALHFEGSKSKSNRCPILAHSLAQPRGVPKWRKAGLPQSEIVNSVRRSVVHHALPTSF
jgi:hypothetical protein